MLAKCGQKAPGRLLAERANVGRMSAALARTIVDVRRRSATPLGV
jgi:hypothetical protein